MSYKATKPGLVFVLYLGMFFIVLVFISAPFYVLYVFRDSRKDTGGVKKYAKFRQFLAHRVV